MSDMDDGTDDVGPEPVTAHAVPTPWGDAYVEASATAPVDPLSEDDFGIMLELLGLPPEVKTVVMRRDRPVLAVATDYPEPTVAPREE